MKKAHSGGKTASKKKGGKAAPRQISVVKSTVIERGKKEALVKEEYKPTGKGRAKVGLTTTKASPKARNASQTGRSDQSSDKKRTARAPGRREQAGRSGKGSVYYENRENRSDADSRRRI